MQEMVDKSTGIEKKNVLMNPEGRDFKVKRRLSNGRSGNYFCPTRIL